MFGYRLCFVIVAGIFCISILVINFLRRKMHPHPGNMQEYRGNVLEHQGVCESKGIVACVYDETRGGDDINDRS